MNEKLIMSLIEKGIIKPKTQLTAVMGSIDFTGQRVHAHKEFSLYRIIENDKGIFFVASLVENNGTHNPTLYKIPLLSVRTIDGMEIKNLARVYGLRPDGSPSEAKICPITGQPVRRGRKPKWVKEKMAELAKTGTPVPA